MVNVLVDERVRTSIQKTQGNALASATGAWYAN